MLTITLIILVIAYLGFGAFLGHTLLRALLNAFDEPTMTKDGEYFRFVAEWSVMWLPRLIQGFYHGRKRQ